MQKYFNTVTNRTGIAQESATVTVTTYGGGTPTLYAGNGASPLASNVLTTDGNGYFEFYAADGRYSLTITGTYINTIVISDVLLEDPIDGSAALAAAGGAALIGNTPAGTIAAVTVQGAINEIVSDLAAVGGASLVGNAPAGDIVAVTVQDAINELDTEKASLSGLAAAGGAALVGFAPVGTVAADNVQAAIAEVVSDLAASGGAALVGNTPAGTIAAVTVQAALDEIVSDLAASSGASLVGYLPSGTGAVATTVQAKLRESVSVKDFGAVGDGVADDAPAIILAFAAHDKVHFPDGTYLMNSGVTKTADNVVVDFGNSVIVNGSVGYLFTLGASADTPQNTGLRITGGHFTQLDPATASNYNYILVRSVKDVSIRDCVMDNVSNGGITVYAGAEAGVIDGVRINGSTAYTTCRGIWLDGSTASDFNSQYVDTSSITRNATAFPSYAVKDFKITNCTVIVPNYGIYLMNAWDCVIDNCHVDTSGVGSTRCVALNNYSPRSRVTNCTLISDRSCTGILVTQASDDVIISNNVFRGSFGGNRAIYVAYLAQALITNNRFTDTTTQHIQIDMGAFAHIKGNEFVRAARTADNRAVYVTGIDSAASGGAIGTSGTTLAGSGVIFENNLLDRVCLGVYAVGTIAASNANAPSPEFIHVSGNVFMHMDLAATASEYPILALGSPTTSSNMSVRCERNTVYPYTAGDRNRASVSGTNAAQVINEATTATMASFLVTAAAGGGALTSTRLAGSNFSCTVARLGADLVLTPRTQLDAYGSSVPVVLGISDAGGATLPRTYVVRPSGTTFLVSAYDDLAAQISFATAGISFNILLGPIAYGT